MTREEMVYENEKIIKILNAPGDVVTLSTNADGTVAGFNWSYYNPDSSAGGQLVCAYFTPEIFVKAVCADENETVEQILNYCTGIGDNELIDIDTESFKENYIAFTESEEGKDDVIYVGNAYDEQKGCVNTDEINRMFANIARLVIRTGVCV